MKLDIFHAIQRISATLSKYHSKFHECLDDLRLVFRTDGDSEKSRILPTSSPEVLARKLSDFSKKWSEAKDISNGSGKQLFTKQTEKAIKNLNRHIMCGCLSHIPASEGTNRNKRLHAHINSFFHRSRVGILLAYALISVLMHSHNNTIRIKGKSNVRPIFAPPF